MQVREILRWDRRGRALEERASRRGFGKRNDVAQRARVGQLHGNSIEAERDASMRRRAGAEALEQKAKARLCRPLVDAEQRENALLQRRITDPDASAAELRAVEHAVIR